MNTQQYKQTSQATTLQSHINYLNLSTYIQYMYMSLCSFQECHCPGISICPKNSKKIQMYFSYSMQYLLPLKAIDSVTFRCRNVVRISLLIRSRDQFQVPKSSVHGFTYCNHHTMPHSKSGNKGKFLYLNYSTDEIPANFPAAMAPSERKGQ